MDAVGWGRCSHPCSAETLIRRSSATTVAGTSRLSAYRTAVSLSCWVSCLQNMDSIGFRECLVGSSWACCPENIRALPPSRRCQYLHLPCLSEGLSLYKRGSIWSLCFMTRKPLFFNCSSPLSVRHSVASVWWRHRCSPASKLGLRYSILASAFLLEVVYVFYQKPRDLVKNVFSTRECSDHLEVSL